MRIPSGITDQVIYFVAVDATDFVTRETGLSSFTVYRARNGATAAAMTTPTLAEVDATNMPGLYSLLLDEDMTIGSGNDSEEMAFHVTHAGMAPVTRTIELYRPKITAGYTLGVGSDGDLLEVNTLTGHTAQTGDSYARLGAPAGASVSADVAAVKAETAAILDDTDLIDDATSGLAKIATDVAAILVDTGTTLPAQIGTPAGASIAADVAAVKSDTGAILTDTGTSLPSTLATIAGYIDTEVAAIKAKTDNLPAAPAATGDIPSVSAIADAVWDELLSGHAISGSTGAGLSAAGAGGDPWSTALPGAYGAGTAGKIIGDALDAAVSSRASQASIDTVDGIVDSILVDTGTTLPGQIGTPAGASIAADVAAVKSDTGAILTDTGTSLPADLATITGYIDTEVAAIKAVTDALPDSGALTSLATAAALATVDGNVAAILVDTATTIPAQIAGLENLSSAQVNAELVDVLSVDTFAEPSGVPSTTATLADKIGRIDMMMTNKVTVTATKKQFFDAAGNAEFEKDLSDDGTTYAETAANAP